MSSAPNVIEFPRRTPNVERTLQTETQAAVSEERLRIAREIHDVVSYSLATIGLQAGVAARVMHDQPQQVEVALQAIKSASKDALGELRSILGMLREVEDVVGTGLGRLDALAATTTGAGVPTQVRINGRPRPLAASVDLAAFRIAQESLANVLRHAGAASAVVTIVYERNFVLVEVEDDGNGDASGDRVSSAGSGHGIAGMRERARAVGGELETSFRPEGGFRVLARLPVSGRS